MTGHLTGTAGVFSARRDECEQAVQDLSRCGVVDAKSIHRLRQQLGGPLTDLVISVTSLQKKANQKLGPRMQNASSVWWVTEKSLQQASAWQVARLKAMWFGRGLVYDLCCGIGGDAIYLAQRGQIVAVDCDSMMVEMAAANLTAAEIAGERIVCLADAATIEIPADAAVHIDPDRRSSGGRSSRPESYQPAWEAVMEIVRNTCGAVVKLAPAARLETSSDRFTALGETHRCWMSLAGRVREQSLLVGSTVSRAGLTPGTVSAVCVDSDGSATWFAPSGDQPAKVATAAKPRSILIDPDASIRAAGLTETFAHTHDLQLLGQASGFLTCDSMESLSVEAVKMSNVGNVVWSGACDDRKLRREMRSRGVFPTVIKVRGTDHDPAALAKRYRKCGDDPVTLWIGRADGRAFAAITK